MAQKYQHIFFDLDRTLWDFDSNSYECLSEIITKYDLDSMMEDASLLIEAYHRNNLELWELYRKGQMTKEVLRTLRFRMSLAEFGIDDEVLARKIGEDYLRNTSRKTILIPHTLEILDYLRSKYHLHIITNGFQETQEKKLRNSGLDKYFTSMTTSETVGHNKPRPEIFHHAISSVHARKVNCLMVGDDLEVDIAGARNFGIDQVFLNRDEIRHTDPVTYEINSLLELKEIL
jgi:putative hydrolase of the HAD superfamily